MSITEMLSLIRQFYKEDGEGLNPERLSQAAENIARREAEDVARNETPFPAEWGL